LKLFGGSFKKIPTKDFTPDDLPENRWKLLWDVIKSNLWKLVTLNWLYLLFLIPTIFVTGLYIVFAYQLYAKDSFFPRFIPYIADPYIFMPMGKSFFDMGVSVFDLIWDYLRILLITLVIAGPAKAGLYYCIRNLSWGEYSVDYSAFWKAFRANWKQGIFFNFLTGFVYICVYLGIFFYGSKYYEAGNLIYLYALWLIVIVFVFYMMMKIFFFTQLVTYKLKVIQIIKNSFIFSVLQLIKVLPLALIPTIINLTGVPFGQFFFGVFVFTVCGFSFIALFNMTFSNYIFDKYLNDQVPGAIKRRGMRPLKTDKGKA